MMLKKVPVTIMINGQFVEVLTDIWLSDEDAKKSIERALNSQFLCECVETVHNIVCLPSEEAINGLRKSDRNLWASKLRECANRLDVEENK